MPLGLCIAMGHEELYLRDKTGVHYFVLTNLALVLYVGTVMLKFYILSPETCCASVTVFYLEHSEYSMSL